MARPSVSPRALAAAGVCASSCVPASPLESVGAELGSEDVATLLDEHGAIGVAEVMNFPAVINGDEDMIARIRAAGHRRVDGHAPGIVGRRLDAAIASTVAHDAHNCIVVGPDRGLVDVDNFTLTDVAVAGSRR